MRARKHLALVFALALLALCVGERATVNSNVSAGEMPSAPEFAPPHLSSTQRAFNARASQASPTSMLQRSRAQEPISIDHTCTDLSAIPVYWIEQAKAQLRLSYGHTSHGSQPVSGMAVLRDDLSYGGLYSFNTDGAVVSGTLSIADHMPAGDLGNPDRVTWEALTRQYLDGLGSDRNVVIWSWCGQVSSATEADIDTYLSLMDGLEQDYPDVTFVYMTGHLDGSGAAGNLHRRNDQIREYCLTNNKVLFDFADIERFDPDGEDYLGRAADDGCYYDGDGNGSRESNWADEWCAAHPGDPLCAACSCAHSRALNCNLKARAFWWMMARLIGWEGSVAAEPDFTPSYKASSSPFAGFGDHITYTVHLRNATGPLSSPLHLSDTVEGGLSYVAGTLTATTGVVTDVAAPRLFWSGVLSPTPAVTITYVTSVAVGEPRVITNIATYKMEPAYVGDPPLLARVCINCELAYLPTIAKDGP